MTNLTNPALRAPRAPFVGLCSFADLSEIHLAERRFEYARIFKKADRPNPQDVIGMLVTATLVMPNEGDPCICAIDNIEPQPQEDTSPGNEGTPTNGNRPAASTTESTEGSGPSGSHEDRQEPKKPSEASLKFLEDLRKEREITEGDVDTLLQIRFKTVLKDATPQMVRKAIDFLKQR